MTRSQFHALAQVRLDTASVADDVWRPASHHVDGLNPAVEERLLGALDLAVRTGNSRQVGVVVQGAPRVG
jgi:hypothetical protein